MAKRAKKKPRFPTTAFTVGIVLALLPWGMQMIGVTVNLWLGLIILFAAFLAMVYAFWNWERTTKWHKVWRILTILIAATIYFNLVGFQIRREARKERQAQSAASQPPSKNQPMQPPAAIPSQLRSSSTVAQVQETKKPIQSKSKTDPCPNGYTILDGATASRSQWDHAKTTGFYFDGPNPCVKLKRTKSIDNTTGYEFSGGSKKPHQNHYR